MSSKKTPPPAARKRKAPTKSNTAPKIPVVRKKPLTYTQAVGDIRNMFLEQAAMWKDQTERLVEASGTSTGDTSLSQHEPWSFLMDDRGRPSTVFGETKASDNDDESKEVEEIKKKLKRTRHWRYDRPVEEDEGEKSDESKEDASDEESDE